MRFPRVPSRTGDDTVTMVFLRLITDGDIEVIVTSAKTGRRSWACRSRTGVCASWPPI